MAGTGKATIMVVGSLNADLVVRAERVPRAGETLAGNSYARFCGGKGANQAVAAARLGAQVYMLGRVGADLFGDDQLRSLAASGVDTTAVIRDQEATTGVAVIAVEESSGQNRIIVVAGANGRCSPRDVLDHLNLADNSSCVLSQLEVRLDTVESAAYVAKQSGALFILNPAPAIPLPDSLLEQVDIIIPNENEAESLTGVAVKDLGGARQAAQVLCRRGVKCVVMTLGARGVFGFDQSSEFMLPAYPVKAVDTVGAGDAFVGALAVALAEGEPLPKAAAFANAAAAVSVTRFGAQSSMPSRAEVDVMLG